MNSYVLCIRLEGDQNHHQKPRPDFDRGWATHYQNQRIQEARKPLPKPTDFKAGNHTLKELMDKFQEQEGVLKLLEAVMNDRVETIQAVYEATQDIAKGKISFGDIKDFIKQTKELAELAVDLAELLQKELTPEQRQQAAEEMLIAGSTGLFHEGTSRFCDMNAAP